jgi:hypothetical protein
MHHQHLISWAFKREIVHKSKICVQHVCAYCKRACMFTKVEKKRMKEKVLGDGFAWPTAFFPCLFLIRDPGVHCYRRVNQFGL